MIPDNIKKLIAETRFSPEARRLINSILNKSWDRGQLTPGDEAELKKIIDADIFLDEVELGVRKELDAVLQH